LRLASSLSKLFLCSEDSIASYKSHDNIRFVANMQHMGLQEKSRKMIFDTQEICGKLGITEKKYERLRKKVKEEFPDDEMMFELHLLRALRSITKSRA
jgi:hypothetical protein